MFVFLLRNIFTFFQLKLLHGKSIQFNKEFIKNIFKIKNQDTRRPFEFWIDCFNHLGPILIAFIFQILVLDDRYVENLSFKP